MQVRFSNKGTTLIVRVEGEMDHHSAEHVRNRIDGEILKSTTKNLIFDLTDLVFMDSSGIGVIMGRYKNIQKLKGRASIVCTNSQIKRVIKMCGIHKLMGVYNNLDSAVNEMQ